MEFLLSGALMLAGLTRPSVGVAQSPPARLSLQAGVLASTIRLDGRLDETDWATADSIPNLTEIEPEEGGTPAGRTVVKVLADAEVLVFGLVVEYPDSVPVVSVARGRDAELWGEDHIKLVLDTFLDGRSGYVFAVNPSGARYDALVADRGEREDDDWDAIWDAAVVRDPHGWTAEVRIPIKSVIFEKGLGTWGFNVQRRVQALQETDRWASPERDYSVTQTSRAGLLTGLPSFDLGVGLSVRPSLVAGLGVPAPGAGTDAELEPSLDLTQRIGSNLLASLTVNTDFAETEVDARRTNLTRFPLVFPEKRTFFLEGADIFDFGLGLGQEVIPFFSRRIGLVEGREVPIRVGLKGHGRLGTTNLGALAVRTAAVATRLPDGSAGPLVPSATLGVLRVKQNVLRESSVGVIGTFGDPQGHDGSWLGGVDVTYQTSRFRGDKNFLVGVWGLVIDHDGLDGDKTAVGVKVDYPNDTWDIAVAYTRIGDAFLPSLGFVPRPGVQIFTPKADYTYYPESDWLRTMFFEWQLTYVTDLGGAWESYRMFTAPINWRLESGDRAEFNWVPVGERLREPFEVVDGVTIPPGSYHWSRYRLEASLAAKRKFSGQITWWFGGFYDGSLDQIELRAEWKPSALLTLELSGERSIGRLPAGDFTTDLVGTRLNLNVSPDLNFSAFVQYDTEGRSLGSNSRLRWTFSPLGDLFLVYNHNLRQLDDLSGRFDRFGFDSNQFLVKLQYAFRY